MSDQEYVPKILEFGVARFRSFGGEGFRIKAGEKISILLGKNNSGKSNVLRAVNLLRSLKAGKCKEQLELSDWHARRVGVWPHAIVVFDTASVLRADIQASMYTQMAREALGPTVEIRWDLRSGEAVLKVAQEKLTGNTLKFLTERVTGHSTDGYSGAQRHAELVPRLKKYAVEGLSKELAAVLNVPVFREIRADAVLPTSDGSFTGRDIIQRLRDLQSPKFGEEDKRKTFSKVQEFTRDLLGMPELTLNVPASEDKLLVQRGDLTLPLDSYGTGLHHLVIMSTVLATYQNHLVTIEEPEVHLHPELQRKFLRFLQAETTNNYLITTHSNVMLDTLPRAAIYHIQFNGETSSVEPVAATPRSREVLADLGYKASDLLQANGLIWVEGPSDRIYLNKWLSLVRSDLVEGIHYAITFYGGKTLSHFTADEDLEEDLVQVLHINQNAAAMIDRDAPRLNKTKRRIQAELLGACWITAGKEIENYLPIDLVQRALGDRWEPSTPLECGQDEAMIDKVGAGLKKGAKKYGEKVALAKLVTEHMTAADMNILDLNQQVGALIARVEQWNHVEMIATPPA